MTAPPLTLSKKLTLCEATTAMAERKVSGAPVVDDTGRLVGMLSERDIMDFAVSKEGGNLEVTTLSFVALPYEKIVRDAELCSRYKRVGEAKVENVMNEEVVTIDQDEDIEKALETMVRFEVNRLPVVDRDKLVGIVARHDILVSICRGLGVEGTKACVTAAH